MQQPTYTMRDTADGLEVLCSACKHIDRFGTHATVEGIRDAKREHTKLHDQRAVISVLDERQVVIDKATVYLNFRKGDEGIQLVLQSLNPLGRAGAWVWRYDGSTENIEWLRKKLYAAAGVNGEQACPVQTAIAQGLLPGRA